MSQVRKGGALCAGLSAVSAGSGFEDLLSLLSGWTFEGQLSTTFCRTGAGSSTDHFEDSRRRSGWSGAPKGSWSCLSACGIGGRSSSGGSCGYVSFLMFCYLAIMVVYCLCWYLCVDLCFGFSSWYPLFLEGLAWLWICVSGFRFGIRCSLRVWYDYSLVFCAIVGYRS